DPSENPSGPTPSEKRSRHPLPLPGTVRKRPQHGRLPGRKLVRPRRGKRSRSDRPGTFPGGKTRFRPASNPGRPGIRMMDRLQIYQIEFHGHCGVTLEERTIGQRLSVDIEIECDFTKAAQSDDLK